MRFLRYVTDRAVLARLLATADVVIAPGPAETFGLSRWGRASCSVVVNDTRAPREVIGQAGLTAPDNDVAFADAIQCLLDSDVESAPGAGRDRAERFGWPAAVSGFLAAHGLAPPAQPPSPATAAPYRAGGAR